MTYKPTIAEKLHEAYQSIDKVETTIYEAFVKHEPEMAGMIDEFTIDSDPYDNSLEVYLPRLIDYPWEPSWNVRDEIYALGFSIVYWNFPDGDEIRGTEPRRRKVAPEYTDAEWCKYAYQNFGISTVDKRFNLEEWSKKYKKSGEKLMP